MAAAATVTAVSPAPIAGDVCLVDEHGLDLGHFSAEGQRAIAAPVDRRHLLVVPGHLLDERAAHALERRRLRSDSSCRPGSRSGRSPCATTQRFTSDDAGVLIDLDLGHHGAIAVVAFVEHAGDAAAGDDAGPPGSRPRRRPRVPAGGLRRGRDDVSRDADRAGAAAGTRPGRPSRDAAISSMKHSCANVFCSRAGERSGPVKNGDAHGVSEHAFALHDAAAAAFAGRRTR